MISPCCKADSIVLDSRFESGRQRRRRQCTDCQARFTTYEVTRMGLEQLKRLKDLCARIEDAVGDFAPRGSERVAPRAEEEKQGC